MMEKTITHTLKVCLLTLDYSNPHEHAWQYIAFAVQGPYEWYSLSIQQLRMELPCCLLYLLGSGHRISWLQGVKEQSEVIGPFNIYY